MQNRTFSAVRLIVPPTDPEPSSACSARSYASTQTFRRCQKSLGVRRRIFSGHHWSVVNFALMQSSCLALL